jgi:hypothetical protein
MLFYRQTANLVTVISRWRLISSHPPCRSTDKTQVKFRTIQRILNRQAMSLPSGASSILVDCLYHLQFNPRKRKVAPPVGLSVASATSPTRHGYCLHYNRRASVIIMLALLTLLIASYLRLDVNRSPVTRAERWSVDVPFGIYLGWITVATVANVTDWLYLVEWNGFGIAASTWAVIMIAVASLVGLAMAFTRRDAAYLFVLVWSFVGIAVNQTPALDVVLAGWIGAGLVLVLAMYSLFRREAA